MSTLDCSTTTSGSAGAVHARIAIGTHSIEANLDPMSLITSVLGLIEEYGPMFLQANPTISADLVAAENSGLAALAASKFAFLGGFAVMAINAVNAKAGLPSVSAPGSASPTVAPAA